MPPDRQTAELWLFGRGPRQRYTQDSPILPDVWLAYAEAPENRVDLLIEPHADSDAADVALALNARLSPEPNQSRRVAYNQAYAVACLWFDELIREVLPLSPWWQTRLWPATAAKGTLKWVRYLRSSEARLLTG
jgi:serine protease AprX